MEKMSGDMGDIATKILETVTVSCKHSKITRTMSDNADSKSVMSNSEAIAFRKLKKTITEEFGSTAADDNRITRFLKARDFDVKLAYAMLKKNLDWRIKHKVDTLIRDYKIRELFAKYLTCNLLGFDKEGSPIIIMNFGKMDNKGFAKAITNEEMARHLQFCLELCEQVLRDQSKQLERNVDTWLIISNMEEFTLSQVTSKTVLERGINLCVTHDAHYPERLKKFFIINCPASVKVLYSMVRPFVAAKTLEKVFFFGKDGWKEKLLEIMDPEVLPAYLGGENTDPDGNPLCKTFISHGGLLPEKFYRKSSKKFYLKDQPGVSFQVLKRRSKVQLPFDVQVVDSLIEWEIETENHDIDFGLFYKGFKSNGNEGLEELVPLQRLDSCMLYEAGSVKCGKTGTYILSLDNSYSFLKSKNVYYKVTIVNPGEEEKNTSE